MAPPTASNSAVPASQNTAPVAEFHCLFTHDIRRKQKRWHDGYLKFHTFNNRVMVYDTSRNYLGDTYWKEPNALQEGDELSLDKGIMIEVSEAMGVAQTDLTPLFEKKTKSPQRQATPNPPPRPLPRTPVPTMNGLRGGSQLRHKSLNTLLGASKGPIGKAVPMQSPYEARKEQENEWAESASKRQKIQHSRPQTLQVPGLAREGRPATAHAPLPQVVSKLPEPRNAGVPPKPVLKKPNVIILESDSDTISSDLTLPMTSPTNARPKPISKVTSAPTSNDQASEKVVAPAPRIPKGKIPLPSSKPKETPKKAPLTSSPPVSVSNRIKNIDFAIPDKSQANSSPVGSPPRNPKAKSLRLSKGSRRGMLLCQAIPQQQIKVAAEPIPLPKRSMEKRATNAPKEDHVPAFPGDDAFSLEKIPSRIDKSIPISKEKRKAASSAKEITKKKRTKEPSPELSFDEFGDMPLIDGLMDQPLLVHSSPPQPPDSSLSVSLEELIAPSPETREARSTKAKEKTKRKQPTKEIQPQTNKEPESHLRKASENPPPKVAPSTGGLGKKPPTRQTNAAATATSTTEPRPVAAALQPHSLRASKANAALSTTDLSAALQKPQKQPSIEDDPIEDSSQAFGAAQNRNAFRRVRSANDAPIPSASEDWEKRNLPEGQNGESGTTLIAAGTTSGNPALEKGFKVPQKKASGLAALVKKTDPRHKFQRPQSLDLDTRVTAVTLQGGGEDSASPSPDTDVGPWSTEAFDLFAWRPPARGEGGSK